MAVAAIHQPWAWDVSTLATVVMIENWLFVNSCQSCPNSYGVFLTQSATGWGLLLWWTLYIFPSAQGIYNSVQVITTAPGIDMFILCRHSRNNNQQMGDIYPLTAIQEPVNIVPIFGEQMDQCTDYNNSLDIPTKYLWRQRNFPLYTDISIDKYVSFSFFLCIYRCPLSNTIC